MAKSKSGSKGGSKASETSQLPAALAQALAKLSKQLDGKYCYALPHYSLDSKLKLALVEPGSMELFEDNEVEVDEHPNWFPLARLADEPQFLAVSGAAPHAVAMWEHETGELMPAFDSLAELAAKVLGKGEKTPFEKLGKVLDQASKLVDADKYAEALELLQPWVAQLPKTSHHARFEDGGVARFHNLHGLALKGTKQLAGARAAFELAAAAGDDYAELNILDLLEDEAAWRTTLERGAKLRDGYLDQYTRIWLARYLAVAHAGLGDAASAERELREVVDDYGVKAPDDLDGARKSLEAYATGNKPGGELVRGFLAWFKPKSYDVTPAEAKTNRAWWTSLPHGMRKELLKGIGKAEDDADDDKAKAGPSDVDIARCLDSESLDLDEDVATFETFELFAPLKRLTRLSFYGDPDSLEPLRSLLPKLDDLTVNNDVVKNFAWPSRADRALWKAAEEGDRKGIEKALKAGASLSSRGDFGKAAIHHVAMTHDVELCAWLIAQGADPWAGSHGDSPGIFGLFAPDDKATLEAATKKAGVRHPDEDPWRELSVRPMPRAATFENTGKMSIDIGEPMLAKWPKDVELAMRAPKKEDKIYDLCRLRFGDIIVSERVAELVRGDNVELLPVTLVDHAKKRRPERFFLLNPLEIDCLVVDKCYPHWNHINRDAITDYAALALDPAKIGNAKLFTVAKLTSSPVVIAKDLATKLASIDGASIDYCRR